MFRVRAVPSLFALRPRRVRAARMKGVGQTKSSCRIEGQSHCCDRGQSGYELPPVASASVSQDARAGAAGQGGFENALRARSQMTLRGADIVIIPDHDESGYAHAEAVARMSAGTAKRIRMLKLADHWPIRPKIHLSARLTKRHNAGYHLRA